MLSDLTDVQVDSIMVIAKEIDAICFKACESGMHPAFVVEALLVVLARQIDGTKKPGQTFGEVISILAQLCGAEVVDLRVEDASKGVN